nr:putative reverse transcriptase domain-containing protein [Tanacetum cinerariifolium]
MAIFVISISSGSSEDSMGTPARRVILFGTIPTTIPDTTPVIAPPTTQIDTIVIPTKTPIIAPIIPLSPDYTPAALDYSPASETESDPSEDPSSGHIPPLPYHSSPDLPSTSAGPSRKRRRSPMTSKHVLPLVSRALSPVCADLIPSPKRVTDIGYLADVEVGPRETRVKRVTHHAMPKDIPESAQEGAAETDLTERVAKLERDNKRLRDTVSVESQRVDRLQHGMSQQCFDLVELYKRTIGVDAAYAMKWAELMKLMTEVYCSRNEVQKMETELWNLIVKGNDLSAYTQKVSRVNFIVYYNGP